MQRIRLAALAVAMTLAFSGLAWARDHDDDDHHRDQRADRHQDRDHDRWREREHERWERENRGWRQGNDMTGTMATTAVRSTTVIPMAIRVVTVIPAAVMAAAQSMAGVTTWAITSAIRTASTGLARIWQRTNRSTPILGDRKETAIVATTAGTATRTTTAPNTLRATNRATGQLIGEAEAGDTRIAQPASGRRAA